MTPIRVMIVDDHRMVREGLKVFLSTTPDLQVVGEAENGAEALALYSSIQPDVVLMDVVMPEMDGAAATARLREDFPDARVVALTSFVDEDLVDRTLKAGAISYLLKDSGPEKLAEAVREAHYGRGSIDSSALQSLLHRTGEPNAADRWSLTPREREVLALLAGGLSNKEIAARLTLSSGTVRLHVSNILAKLGAPNRTAAAMIALRSGLVDETSR